MAAPTSAHFELTQGQLEPTTIHLARLLRLADALQKQSQLNVGVVTRLYRQTCFQITACLAPQLLMDAKLAQREQQQRLTGMLLEPAFGPFQVTPCIARQTLH